MTRGKWIGIGLGVAVALIVIAYLVYRYLISPDGDAEPQCVTDADCPTGFICKNGICVPEGPTAPGNFTGTVTDCDTGAGIASASVEIWSSDYSNSTITDGSGSFSFSNIPAGQYQVTYSASGYKTKGAVEQIRPDDTRDISMCLTSGTPSEEGYVHFHVHDCTDRPYYPIEGVTCYVGSYSGRSNKNGTVNVKTPPGTYQLDFDMPSGYEWYSYAQPMASEVTIIAGAFKTIGIYLARKS